MSLENRIKYDWLNMTKVITRTALTSSAHGQKVFFSLFIHFPTFQLK
jgi:hypothetical protein